MSWLNRLLSVGTLTGQWTSLHKLEALKRQLEVKATIQAVLHELRNQIFNYRQSAEEIITAEAKSPKRAAAAMKLLELQFHKSEISPGLFLDLNDKVYVADTARFIRDNARRLLARLPASEQVQVAVVVEAAIHLADYEYYLTSYDDAMRYRAALPDAKRHNLAHSGRVAFIVCVGLVAILCASIVFGLAIRSVEIGIVLGAALCFIVMRAYVVNRARWADARKMVDALESRLDLRRFDALDMEFNHDREQVKAIRKHAQELANAFFGDDTAPISVDQITPVDPQKLSSLAKQDAETYAVARLGDITKDEIVQFGSTFLLFAGVVINVPEGYRAASIRLDKPIEPLKLNISVYAEDIDVAPRWSNEFLYTGKDDQELLEFRLIPRAVGAKVIRVEYYYQRHWLAQIVFTVEVVPAHEQSPA